MNSLLTIIHRKHLITKVDKVYSLAARAQVLDTSHELSAGRSQSWGFYSILRWKPPIPGTTRCPCTNLLQFSFLFILGKHSTAIQAVRSIHVSLQPSCRACYLPPNSCLALCSFTFLKSIKDLIFPTGGWQSWCILMKSPGGFIHSMFRQQGQKVYVQTFTCLSSVRVRWSINPISKPNFDHK